MIKDPKKLTAISALVFIGFGLMIAIALIVGIWTEFSNSLLGKAIGTLFVLFFFSGFLHVVAQGMCQKPKEKSD